MLLSTNRIPVNYLLLWKYSVTENFDENTAGCYAEQ